MTTNRIKLFMSMLSFVFLMSSFLSISMSCGSTSLDLRAKQKYEDSIRKELKFGRMVAGQILQQYPMLEDKKATLYINKVGKSVALFAGRNDFEYHFGILDTDSINAFSAPGGYIFITKGAIAACENEGELAAILAHEIAHVNLKHVLKTLPPPREVNSFAERLATLLTAQGAVVSSAMGQVAKQAVKLLFEKGLKIEDEFAADRATAEYLSATGYDANAIIDYLKIIKAIHAQKAKMKVYDTHPPLKKRIKALKKLIKKEKLSTNRPSAKKRFKKYLAHLQIKKNIEGIKN